MQDNLRPFRRLPMLRCIEWRGIDCMLLHIHLIRAKRWENGPFAPKLHETHLCTPSTESKDVACRWISLKYKVLVVLPVLPQLPVSFWSLRASLDASR
jgi:hypothetical protein